MNKEKIIQIISEEVKNTTRKIKSNFSHDEKLLLYKFLIEYIVAHKK